MNRNALLLFAVILSAASSLRAQSTEPPIVIQAANAPAASGAAVAAQPQTAALAADEANATLKILQEIKKGNDETIAKQEATLKTLDELEKAAEQLRIFAKRG